MKGTIETWVVIITFAVSCLTQLAYLLCLCSHMTCILKPSPSGAHIHWHHRQAPHVIQSVFLAVCKIFSWAFLFGAYVSALTFQNNDV